MLWYEHENIHIDNNNRRIINYITPNITCKDLISNSNFGTGDILIFRSHFPNKTIIINIKQVLDYKPYPQNLENIKFIIDFLNILFGRLKFTLFYSKKINITLIQCNIFQIPNFRSLFVNDNLLIDKPYIIFHTKLRLRLQDKHIVDIIKTRLRNFFTNFKSKYKIVLLGEKCLENNKATVAIPHMTTIYDECLCLYNNNSVIDLTHKVLYNTPSINNFTKDVNIIANAMCNIGCGHGGQWCINVFFSTYSIYFGPPELYPATTPEQNMNIITNIDNFINIITNNFGV